MSTGMLTRRQLDSKVWVRVLRDVYRHTDLALTGTVRAQALSLVLPADGVVSGRTAAWLHGVWKPRPGSIVPLEFARRVDSSGSVFTTARKRRLTFLPSMMDGITQLSDGCLGDLVEICGIPATSALRTCFELMRDRSLVEAVVVVDAFIHAEAITAYWLDAYVELHRRWPGVRQARVAVALASNDARSPGESRLRMIVVLGGLPEPLANSPVYSAANDLVGYPDLLVRGTPRMVGLEYDGAYHDTLNQHRADNRRENRFAVETGLVLLRFGADDVRLYADQTLKQIVKASGWRGRYGLDPAQFRRTSPGLAW